MKISLFIIVVVSLLHLTCQAQTVRTKIPKKVYIKNDIIEARHTVRWTGDRKFKLARIITPNSRIDTAEQVESGATYSPHSKTVKSITVRTKIKMGRGGRFDLPFCEFQFSDTTVSSKSFSVKVSRNKLSKAQVFLGSIRSNWYTNIVVYADTNKNVLSIIRDRLPRKIKLGDTIMIKLMVVLPRKKAERDYSHSNFFSDNFTLLKTWTLHEFISSDNFEQVDEIKLTLLSPSDPFINPKLAVGEGYYGLVPTREGSAKINFGNIKYAGKEYHLGAFKVRVRKL